MGIFNGLRSKLHKVSGLLILGGCLFVALDAVYYQKEASKRETSRCEQIKKITEAMVAAKDDPNAVEFYCNELKKIAEAQAAYRWKLGSSLSN